MAPISFSTVIPAITKNAPKAPECPKDLEISAQQLEIQYKAGEKNECGVVFERRYVENRITMEMETFNSTAHHAALLSAAADFRKAMEHFFPGSQSWLVGSFAAGVDLPSSDLDFTVKVPSLGDVSSFQKLMQMRQTVFGRLNAFEKTWVQGGKVPVLQMLHTETGVSIDVSIDNDSAKRNTQLLCWYGQIDERYPLLTKVMKAWAAIVGVEGSRRERLNSFSLCLMMIHYLQYIGVLPNIQELFPDIDGDFVVESDDYQKRNLKKEIQKQGKFQLGKNKDSLAALFLGFLKYYSEFDFQNNWISVRHGRLMVKRVDEEGQPMDGLPVSRWFIVVADPFLKVPRNCAGSVQQRNYMERIQEEFQLEYQRVLSRKTIFLFGPCPWSRRLTEEGKKRDNQIEEVMNECWKMTSVMENSWESEGYGSDVEWGQEDRPDGYIQQEPSHYWNLEEKKKREYEKVKDWPELLTRVI